MHIPMLGAMILSEVHQKKNEPPDKNGAALRIFESSKFLTKNIAHLVDKSLVFQIFVLNLGKLFEQAPLFSG